jgi:hypothetical protein
MAGRKRKRNEFWICRDDHSDADYEIHTHEPIVSEYGGWNNDEVMWRRSHDTDAQSYSMCKNEFERGFKLRIKPGTKAKLIINMAKVSSAISIDKALKQQEKDTPIP